MSDPYVYVVFWAPEWLFRRQDSGTTHSTDSLPTGHINVRSLQSSSEAQDTGDSSNHGLQGCLYVTYHMPYHVLCTLYRIIHTIPYTMYHRELVKILAFIWSFGPHRLICLRTASAYASCLTLPLLRGAVSSYISRGLSRS